MDTNVQLDTEKGDVEIIKSLLVIPSQLKKTTSYKAGTKIVLSSFLSCCITSNKQILGLGSAPQF